MKGIDNEGKIYLIHGDMTSAPDVKKVFQIGIKLEKELNLLSILQV